MTSFLNMMGLWLSPTFTAKDVPDQTGKVSIVTGGNAGIGKETCLALAAKGGRVYLAARSKEKAEATIEEIKQKTDSDNIFYLPLDLQDLASVKAAAEEFMSKEKELHVLYNNAGVMATPFSLTKDGFENQWGTNVVGHFALTKSLLPVLKSTAAHNPAGTVRVINVSSYGHGFAPRGGIDFNNINLENAGTWTRYGQSKLGNILLTKEITRRYGKDGIQSISIHPGGVDTELARPYSQSWGLSYNWVTPIMRYFMISAANGAVTQLWAGTHPDAGKKEMNGKYLVPYAREREPSAYATDPELAKKLWERLEKDVDGKI